MAEAVKARYEAELKDKMDVILELEKGLKVVTRGEATGDNVRSDYKLSLCEATQWMHWIHLRTFGAKVLSSVCRSTAPVELLVGGVPGEEDENLFELSGISEDELGLPGGAGSVADLSSLLEGLDLDDSTVLQRSYRRAASTQQAVEESGFIIPDVQAAEPPAVDQRRLWASYEPAAVAPGTRDTVAVQRANLDAGLHTAVAQLTRGMATVAAALPARPRRVLSRPDQAPWRQAQPRTFAIAHGLAGAVTIFRR